MKQLQKYEVKRAGAQGGSWEGLFLRPRFYAFMLGTILIMPLGLIWEPITYFGLLLLLALFALSIGEYIRLAQLKQQLLAGRALDDRLSLNETNRVAVEVENRSKYNLNLTLLDELPVQFQERNFGENFSLQAGEIRQVNYSLEPKTRGVYSFGQLLLFATTSLGLVERRFYFGDPVSEVAVYPSIIGMKRQALRARNLARTGDAQIKRRTMGRSYEFDQIKNYVAGDDYRQLNWKASARSNALMINTYIEERSQQIVAVIDTGRAMLSPFAGLSLLDYSINSALALLNVAFERGDRAGLIAFDKSVTARVPSSTQRGQVRRLLKSLYHLQPSDFESDFDALNQIINREVKGRSMLLFYTNFDTMIDLERKLPVLRRLARRHLVVIVEFINAEIQDALEATPVNKEDAYFLTIAAEYRAEREQIAATLTQNNISILRTRPEDLSANAVTHYLETKRSGRL